jgi:hypothetical protein
MVIIQARTSTSVCPPAYDQETFGSDAKPLVKMGKANALVIDHG